MAAASSVSEAVGVLLDGSAWVQAAPADGAALAEDPGRDTLASMTARPRIAALPGSVYRIDAATVVASAAAVERVMVAEEDGPLGVVVTRIAGVPVLATREETSPAPTARSGADERFRHSLGASSCALVAEAGQAEYGRGLVGACKRAVAGCRLLVVGRVDFASARVVPAVQRRVKAAAAQAASEAAKEMARVPAALWRVVAVATGEAAGLPEARAFAMGAPHAEAAELDGLAAGADSATVRAVERRPAGAWRGLPAALDRLGSVLRAARRLPADGGASAPRALLWSASAGASVGDAAASESGPLVAPAFAEALAAAAPAPSVPRAVKRPRQDGDAAPPEGSASARPRADLEAAILAGVPKGHDDRRRALASAAASASATSAARSRPVRARIPDAGPWMGLSMHQWPDPPHDPRLVRLRAEDDAWVAATRSRGPTSVAIIVPFRDQPAQNRMAQLERFAEIFPRWFAALRPAPRRWHVIVVEQTADGFKFNRGKLLNVGFRLAQADCGPDGRPFGGAAASAPGGGAGSEDAFDIVVMHDVDLLPTSDAFGELYMTPRAGPVPIAKAWERYRYPNYIGGITAFATPLFRKINGYPNNFWGWGGEDDDLRRRLEAVGYPPDMWHKPPAALDGRIRDLEEELIAERGGKRASVKLRDNGSAETLNLVRTELLRDTYKTWWRNGLASADFAVRGYRTMGPHVTVVTVDLLAAKHADSVRLTDLPFWAKHKGRA